MNAIRILSENVASQIAAGEVIDRPASVVRELIDNSIDAGADRIAVEIENGGKGLIKVNDNGVGMSRDDLLLCVERHATSKIETASDLFSVKSFGFRGEALPSIASVSRTEIVTRPHDQLEGHRLKISGGKLIAIEAAGCPDGTIIAVKDLFYNIPARRKFLRAARTETDHVIDVFSRAALAFPDVGFKLADAKKSILNLPPSDQPLHRLHALMGRKVAESMIEAREEGVSLRITAYLAPAEMSRTRGDRVFVYVNRRHIRDRLVTKAILEGYRQRLMKGQYPQAVVFIETDPAQVDVNVHPTKQEVRFHNSRAVFQTIVSCIEKALSRRTPADIGLEPLLRKENVHPGEISPFAAESAWRYAEAARSPTPLVESEASEPPLLREGPQIIGQLGNTYILCQMEDGLLMVDQHAAHERIVYESLKKGLKRSRIEIQALLIPYKLELSKKEQRFVHEKSEQLKRFGIELEHFGGNTFLLRSVPAILGEVEWESFLSELIAELMDDTAAAEGFSDNVLKVMACHGAIRAGHRMSREEIGHLMSRLNETEIPTNCPHGRPIFKRFTYYEIEKMFKRVV
jgi:DNA mismatch repair protein MutL